MILRTTTVVDLDNCISDDQWRMKYIDLSREDVDDRYRRYHEQLEFDRAMIPDALREGSQRIVVFTSRPYLYRAQTELWLLKHGIRASNIYMRDNTHMPCVELKAEFLDLELARGADIIRAYDDRQDIVDMYNAAGINGIRLAINER